MRRKSPRAIDFHCQDCKYIEGEIFMPDEDIPEILNHYCPMCGGILRKLDIKNNSQTWKWRDKK